MKRAPIIEDWSRFNRAVLEVADGLPQLVARKQPAKQQPKRQPSELVSEAGDGGDTYGLIARRKWRKHA
jgi:hypothetical protein